VSERVKIPSVLMHLKKLWGYISTRRRTQLFLLFLLTIFVSFAEIFSIGAIIPFLGALTNPQKIFNLNLAQPLIKILGITSVEQFLLIITLVFCSASLLAGTLRILLLWASSKLAFLIGSDLSFEVYSRTLHQPYAIHISRNTGDIINTISRKTETVIHLINAVLTLLSATVIMISVVMALLLIDVNVALLSIASIGLIYAFIIRLTRKRMFVYGQIIASESTRVIKTLQEGLGGIRDILIDGTQKTYCSIYSAADLSLRRAQAASHLISGSPRYFMEVLGMLLISILAYKLSQDGDFIMVALPTLGALALGAQRLLPVSQQMYQSWSSIRSSQSSMEDVLRLLEQPMPDFNNELVNLNLPFDSCIFLNNISFKYKDNGPWVLKNINLSISKGSRFGFIGESGSGKSTLIDIIMGLLVPTSGELKIDGQLIDGANHQQWRSRIAHVPQTIFLIDASISENIAFGVPKEDIDFERVRWASSQAQIAETIEGWRDQYHTAVGERGVRLSGGQRQRIGIARALYKKADVLVFDEATSALDSDTEKGVMDSIKGLSRELTIIIIAHRHSTLDGCTHIVKVVEAGIELQTDFGGLDNC
jgi:ABC-type multidrug transport system fused ATPase/permease subunit